MKRSIFAVCDLEASYAVNFMEFLHQKKNIPFEIQAFTSVETLLAYAASNPIELLLISDKAMCREVRELKIGKIVILSEGAHLPGLDQYPCVYKYQASSDVIREVSATGGVLIMAIGIVQARLLPIRLANQIPALPVAILLVKIFM